MKDFREMSATHSLAVDSAQFISNDDREVRRFQALAEFSRVALTSQFFDEVVEAGMATLVRSLDVDYAKLLRCLDGGAGFRLEWGLGWNSGYLGEAVVAPDTGSQAGFTFTQLRPVIVNDLRWERRFNAPPLLVQHRVKSGMSVSVHGKAKPFGVVAVHCRNQRCFSLSDVVFFDCVARIISAALTQRESLKCATEKQATRCAQADAVDGSASSARVLRGWKEIAAYMGSGVRTAQRWEQKYALPIHRPAAKLKSCVISSTSELDNWVQRSPTRE